MVLPYQESYQTRFCILVNLLGAVESRGQTVTCTVVAGGIAVGANRGSRRREVDGERATNMNDPDGNATN